MVAQSIPIADLQDLFRPNSLKAYLLDNFYFLKFSKNEAILKVNEFSSMKEFFGKNKTFIAIIIAAFIIGCFVGYLFKTSQIQSQLFPLETEEIKGTPSFIMANNLSCQILYSTNKEDVGKYISLLNLFSDVPRALFPSGVDSPMQKAYETENVLTMILIASGSGGIDAFVLDKKTGIFARVSAGSFLGVYSVASRGNCK